MQSGDGGSLFAVFQPGFLGGQAKRGANKQQ
jgi:hypothetical protein